MRRIHSHLLFLLLFCSPFLSAQTDPTALQTITTGPTDDRNPVLARSAAFWMSNGVQWLLFERHTADSSFIMGKRYFTQGRVWDSTEVVIAASSAAFPLIHPDVASMLYTSSHSYAVWVRNGGTKPEVFGSVCDSSLHWSLPILLGTGDAPRVIGMRNVNVAVNGKYFVLWQKDGTIIGAVVAAGGKEASDTISVTAGGRVSFDAALGSSSVIDVVQSGRTDNGQWRLLHSTVTLPAISVTKKETLITMLTMDPEPQFIQGVPIGLVLWTSALGNDVTIVSSALVPFSPQLFNNTGTAMKRGVRAYAVPVVTAKRSVQPSFFGVTVLAYERVDGMDSVVVIHKPTSPGKDTIRSASYNRAPSIGSFYIPGEYILTVWESGRSGRAHIYGKLIYNPLYTVEDEDTRVPGTFALEQNYPNPFNPSTTISYQLPKDGMVRLSVFDLLGREAAVLVNGPEQSGRHTVAWDASRAASGVYFLRLSSGERSAVRRMLLLR